MCDNEKKDTKKDWHGICPKQVSPNTPHFPLHPMNAEKYHSEPQKDCFKKFRKQKQKWLVALPERRIQGSKDNVACNEVEEEDRIQMVGVDAASASVDSLEDKQTNKQLSHWIYFNSAGYEYTHKNPQKPSYKHATATQKLNQFRRIWKNPQKQTKKYKIKTKLRGSKRRKKGERWRRRRIFAGSTRARNCITCAVPIRAGGGEDDKAALLYQPHAAAFAAALI